VLLDDLIEYLETLNDQNKWNSIKEFSTIAGYKININIRSLHMNKQHIEVSMVDRVPFTATTIERLNS
jgi:hypothetical protein